MKTKQHIIKISLIFVLSAMDFTYAVEKKPIEMIQSISKTVEIADNEIVIKMKSEGQRYLFSVDDSTPRVLAYDEVVRLKKGFKKATFKSRGYSLFVTSSDGSPGQYTISESVDARSSGRPLKSSTKSFSISTNKLQESP